MRVNIFAFSCDTDQEPSLAAPLDRADGGYAIAVMGLSGAVLAFRPQIQQSSEPKPAAFSTCAIPAALPRAAAHLHGWRPQARIDRVVFPEYDVRRRKWPQAALLSGKARRTQREPPGDPHLDAAAPLVQQLARQRTVRRAGCTAHAR